MGIREFHYGDILALQVDDSGEWESAIDVLEFASLESLIEYGAKMAQHIEMNTQPSDDEDSVALTARLMRMGLALRGIYEERIEVVIRKFDGSILPN